MKSYSPVGWRGESHRHYLAAKGIKSGFSSPADRNKYMLLKEIFEDVDTRKDARMRAAYARGESDLKRQAIFTRAAQRLPLTPEEEKLKRQILTETLKRGPYSSYQENYSDKVDEKFNSEWTRESADNYLNLLRKREAELKDQASAELVKQEMLRTEAVLEKYDEEGPDALSTQEKAALLNASVAVHRSDMIVRR